MYNCSIIDNKCHGEEYVYFTHILLVYIISPLRHIDKFPEKIADIGLNKCQFKLLSTFNARV